MLSYSPLEDYEPENNKPVLPKIKKTPVQVYERTESDYVVMAFVLGTLVILISDMFRNK